MSKPAPFDWADPLNLNALLTEEERMIYDSATAFAAAELAPIVRESNRHETCDRGLMAKFGAAGLLGALRWGEFTYTGAGTGTEVGATRTIALPETPKLLLFKNTVGTLMDQGSSWKVLVNAANKYSEEVSWYNWVTLSGSTLVLKTEHRTDTTAAVAWTYNETGKSYTVRYLY